MLCFSETIHWIQQIWCVYAHSNPLWKIKQMHKKWQKYLALVFFSLSLFPRTFIPPYSHTIIRLYGLYAFLGQWKGGEYWFYKYLYNLNIKSTNNIKSVQKMIFSSFSNIPFSLSLFIISVFCSTCLHRSIPTVVFCTVRKKLFRPTLGMDLFILQAFVFCTSNQ